MNMLSMVLSVLSVVIAIPLLVISVRLFTLIKSGENKTVEEIAGTINKATTAIAVLAVIEAALMIVKVFIR